MFEQLMPYLTLVWYVGMNRTYVLGLKYTLGSLALWILGVVFGTLAYKSYLSQRGQVGNDIPMIFATMAGALFIFASLLLTCGLDYILSPEYMTVQLLLELLPF